MITMKRWVERNGTRVEFGNIAGGFCGKPYVYEFPDEKLAKRFAAFAKKIDKDKMPVAIPEDHWARKYFKGHA